MLQFQPITPGIKTLADSYTFKYGEGSCQHSFVSSWTLRHKYADEFCEHEGYLYTLRAKLCTENERVYLFPHGPRDDYGALRRAVQNIIDDAHSHKCRAKFQTVTQSANDIITSLFPGQFTADHIRDWAEYVYSIESLSTYSGHELANKRRDFNRFERDYEGRAQARLITPDDLPALWAFEDEWLRRKLAASDDELQKKYLMAEREAIGNSLNDWEMLGLTGVAVVIDGVIRGYAYGSRLSDDYIDEMCEKGDITFHNIYTFIRHEFARICGAGMKFLNLEEDIGQQYLRTAKEYYKPAFLMDKYILTENE